MPSPPGELGRKAALVVLVQVGFYLLGWGVVVAALGVGALELWADRLTLGGIVSALFGLWFAWALLPPWDRWQDPGPRLEPSEHPELFALLGDLAAEAGLRPPHDVYLVQDVNAFIGARRKGPRRRRYMGIGLPLFQVLTVGELRAVIAHEYGHEHRGDLRLGPWIHGSRRAIASSLAKMDDDGVGLHLFFNWYGRMYVRLSQEISREQELHADALSAELAGAGPARRALRRTEETGPLWLGYWHQELLPVLNRGLRPPIFEGFARYREAPAVREHVERVAAAAPEEADPYDSHPTLAEREAALAGAPERAPAPGDEARASVLLEGAESLYLDHIAVEGARFEDMAWEAIGERYWLPRWREELAPHRGALQGLTLEAFPAAVQDVEGWVSRLRGDGPRLLSAEASRRRARGLLATWLAVHLADRGWRIVTLPGGPVRAVGEEREVAPFKLVDALIEDPGAWPADLV